MSFARAVCPPQALEAFSTGFMSKIKPQVEFDFNHKCVEFDRGRAYPRAMSEKTIGEQIKEAIDRKGLKQTALAERCGVSDNAVSKWIKTGKVSKEKIPLLCQLLELDAGIFLGAGSDGVAVTLPKINNLPAREIAKALAISVQAIAEKWGVSVSDLMDGSPAAMARVEAAISERLPTGGAAPDDTPDRPTGHSPRHSGTAHDYNPPGAGRKLKDEPDSPPPTQKDGSEED